MKDYSPMFAASHREHLRELLKQLSVRKGSFVLASGRRSDLYVDAKLTTCRAQAMPLVAKCFLEKFREHGWRPAAVGGLAIGADPLVIAIARGSLDVGPPINAFLVRKEPKKHGLEKYLEGLESPGSDVVIVDDVCTTGGSTMLAIGRARESGLNVLGAVCLVDRQMGAKQRIEKDLNCPFDCVFTIGDLLEDDFSGEPVSVTSPHTAGTVR